jgi:hypothetical protein
MMKSKMMASGGAMKSKMMASGGMPMVMKDGKKVPAFAADGKGKMAKGGMMSKMKAGGGVAPSKMGAVKTGSGMDGLSRVKTKGMMPKMTKRG